MKIIQKYLLPIIVIALIIIAIFLDNKKSKDMLVEETQPLIFSENTAIDVFANKDSYIKNLCYLYEKAVVTNTKPSVYDREYIKLTIVDGKMVSGVHDVLPAEKDSNKATFLGATNGEYVNVIAMVKTKGQVWQEQRVYKRADEKIYVGYQKTPEPRVKNENGIFMYNQEVKDLQFETEKFYLGIIDCNELEKKISI
jgi:hypothetical protein